MPAADIKQAVKSVPLVRSIWAAGRKLLWYSDFVADFFRFRRLAGSASERFALRWQERYPCLGDKTAGTGYDRHYVYHPAWAARILARTKPPFHIDISSSLSFVSMLSAFVPVKFYDYRPADLSLSNLECERGDLMALPFADGSVQSLSCMHVIEHIGLGRYGDPLDPEGDLKAMAELKRVLAPGGSLLFVVPVGLPALKFNAHRIYSYRQIRIAFSELTLKDFTLVPELPSGGAPIANATEEQASRESYGCGCFWFRKE